METLTTYTKEGSTFTLLARKGDIAIFKGVRDEGWGTVTFEVIHIQSQEAGERTYPDKNNPGERVTVQVLAKEYPPHTNTWGDSGWTCVTEEAAYLRFDKEVAKEQTKGMERVAQGE